MPCLPKLCSFSASEKERWGRGRWERGREEKRGGKGREQERRVSGETIAIVC